MLVGVGDQRSARDLKRDLSARDLKRELTRELLRSFLNHLAIGLIITYSTLTTNQNARA